MVEFNLQSDSASQTQTSSDREKSFVEVDKVQTVKAKDPNKLKGYIVIHETLEPPQEIESEISIANEEHFAADEKTKKEIPSTITTADFTEVLGDSFESICL